MSTKLLLGLLTDERKDKRWMLEQCMGVLSGVAERDTARIAALEKIADDSFDKAARFLEALAERKVEEKALAIEEADHAEDRADRRVRRDRENMTADIGRRLAMEAIAALGKIVPGFIEEIKKAGVDPSLPAGKEQPRLPPSPYAMPSNGATPIPQTQPAPAALPQLAPVPEEKILIDRFVDACKGAGLDEEVFGKDDNDGAIISPGILSRRQVSLLSGVRTGRMPVDALDALLPDAGPDSITPEQLSRVVPMLLGHPQVLQDVTRLMELRSQKRAK